MPVRELCRRRAHLDPWRRGCLSMGTGPRGPGETGSRQNLVPISPPRVQLFSNLRTFPIDQLVQTGKQLSPVQSLTAVVSRLLHGSPVSTPSDQRGWRRACPPAGGCSQRRCKFPFLKDFPGGDIVSRLTGGTFALSKRANYLFVSL